jgi:hypothetical protein
MPILSINYLSHIPLIPLTVELARGNRNLTNELATEKLKFALHEAAHLVAAMACPKSTIHYVHVHPTGKGWRGVGGSMRSDEKFEDEESFVSLVGYAWEEEHGDVATAKGDHARGFNPSYPDVLTKARAFIVSHDDHIRHAATGILCLCTAKGELDGLRLKALVKWLRPQVTIFRSQDAKYTTGLQLGTTIPGRIGAMM